MTALHDAAKVGDINKVNKLIKGSFISKSIPVDTRDNENRTALYVALLHNQNDTAHHLVKMHHADVNLVISLAFKNKNLDVIRRIPSRMTINIIDIIFNERWFYSKEEFAQRIMEILYSEVGIWSSDEENKSAQNCIQELKIDVNNTFLEGKSAFILHRAIFVGNVAFAKFLIKACNANVNIISFNGTALHAAMDMIVEFQHQTLRRYLATHEDREEMVRFLLEETDIDLTIRNSAGKTVIEEAQAPHYQWFKTLLKQHEKTPAPAIDSKSTVQISVDENVNNTSLHANNDSDEEINIETSATIIDKNQSWSTRVASYVSSYLPWSFTQSVGSNSNENNISFSMISSDEVTFESEIARGGYGIVYLGTWSNTVVAIKKLINNQPTSKITKAFEREIQIMSNSKHPNIVQFYGVVSQIDTYCIVMEYMSGGTLYELLHSSETMSEEMRKQLALDITRGMHYLHKNNVLHRDFKSLNVLLDEKNRAKISDFGLAKITRGNENSEITSETVIGSLRWTPPEILNNEKHTKKSDIYSLGMVLWEIYSRQLPFQNYKSPQAIMSQIANCEEPEIIPKTCSIEYAKLIQFCWQKKPVNRPEIEEVINILQEVNTEEVIPAENELDNNVLSGGIFQPMISAIKSLGLS